MQPVAGIGERLKRVREELGLGQRELGRRAEVSQSLISKLEDPAEERPRTSKETIEKLSRALGVEETWLVHGRGPKERGAAPEGPMNFADSDADLDRALARRPYSELTKDQARAALRHDAVRTFDAWCEYLDSLEIRNRAAMIGRVDPFPARAEAADAARVTGDIFSAAAARFVQTHPAYDAPEVFALKTREYWDQEIADHRARLRQLEIRGTPREMATDQRRSASRPRKKRREQAEAPASTKPKKHAG